MAAIDRNSAQQRRFFFKKRKQITIDENVQDFPKRKALVEIHQGSNNQSNIIQVNRHSKKLIKSKSIDLLCGVLRQVSIESNKLPANVVDIDCNASDPANCNAIAEDVSAYMRKLECCEELKVKKDYLKTSQKFVTNEMRAILIDWLLQVQHCLGLQQETIYKTVILLDRFLSVQKVITRNLQLVGLTCLFISSKCVEHQPPPARHLIHLAESSYTYESLIRMEWFVLSKVKFNLAMADPSFFLCRLLMASNVDIKGKHDRVLVKNLSSYFIDQMMPYSETLNYKPSLLSSAALCLARYMIVSKNRPAIAVRDPWTPTLKYYSKYCKETLQPVIQRIAKRRSESATSKLQGAVIKYSSRSKYNNLAHTLLLKKTAFSQIAANGIPS